jgi:hypothetical protein
MRTSSASPAALTVLFSLALGLAACGSRDPATAVPSINALAEDPILLSRVLERCNANPAAASTMECTHARAAADRRFAAEAEEKARRAEAGFEMAREARRRAEEAASAANEAARRRVDAYELPVEGAEGPGTAEP